MDFSDSYIFNLVNSGALCVVKLSVCWFFIFCLWEFCFAINVVMKVALYLSVVFSFSAYVRVENVTYALKLIKKYMINFADQELWTISLSTIKGLIYLVSSIAPLLVLIAVAFKTLDIIFTSSNRKFYFKFKSLMWCRHYVGRLSRYLLPVSVITWCMYFTFMFIGTWYSRVIIGTPPVIKILVYMLLVYGVVLIIVLVAFMFILGFFFFNVEATVKFFTWAIFTHKFFLVLDYFNLYKSFSPSFEPEYIYGSSNISDVANFFSYRYIYLYFWVSVTTVKCILINPVFSLMIRFGRVYMCAYLWYFNINTQVPYPPENLRPKYGGYLGIHSEGKTLKMFSWTSIFNDSLVYITAVCIISFILNSLLGRVIGVIFANILYIFPAYFLLSILFYLVNPRWATKISLQLWEKVTDKAYSYDERSTYGMFHNLHALVDLECRLFHISVYPIHKCKAYTRFKNKAYK